MPWRTLLIDAVVDVVGLACVTLLVMTDQVEGATGLMVIVALLGVKTGGTIKGHNDKGTQAGRGGAITSILAFLFAANAVAASPVAILDGAPDDPADNTGEHRAAQ